MFQRLKQKWGVSPRQLFWILWVFALTGTTTAWITARITAWVGFNEATPWVGRLALRLGMLLVGYQLILLAFAFLLGQFPFFWRYEKKLLQHLRIINKDKDPIKKENHQPV